MSDTFDILFEPVRIGPVTAPNRFYQVPHCNGMGHRMPQSLAAMRGVKAEGGWGVVCTEEVEIHHSSDLAPYIEGRLWDDRDIPALAMMAESVHRHGALAGIELTHNGHDAPNYYSRATPLGPRDIGLMGGTGYEPGQARRMDREDIRSLRRWHRAAALRAKQAGFDLVYCYAGHGLSLPMHFLLRRYNDRSDEYGGSLSNRVRLLRELIEDTKDAVGDSCAVAVRLAVDELLGDEGLTSQGEAHEIVAMLAELPDLWDVNISGWSNDSATARFAQEGYQEPYIAFVKKLTSKPVVGVGRYTSPESMASAVRRGVMDMIGAARPSIADPFLPAKIRAGRVEDIRECIGCNICVSSDTKCVPIRCTQNPTMGEEWRRGWHPEQVAPRQSEAEVLVIGAGPAGLECARALGQRGYKVALAEREREPGGRVDREARLPGLAVWRRVIDWRLSQIEKLPNVTIYPGSAMSAADVIEAGYAHVIIASGADWRRDGVGRTLQRAIPGSELPSVLTPDDLMAGRLPSGRVLIYDDDHYYMGGVLAELLASTGCAVTLATAAPMASYWTQFTLEQERIERRLGQLGVAILTRTTLTAISPGGATLTSTISGAARELPCDAVVLTTDRLPRGALAAELAPALAEGQLRTLRVIGDADAPNIIAQAIFAGHLAAREFDAPPGDGTPFRVE
ncbi:NADH:flavin oxidoreductase [Chloroflexales bacterium ZM16-3]|nr:NADH:flavin oxidoreductase [Chloroflexales bacterium ZM16-3]